MNLGYESPPYDNIGILEKVEAIVRLLGVPIEETWVRDMAHAYDVCATGLGKWNFTGNNNGSAVEPPLVLAPQKVAVEIISWKTPPSWINAANLIPETCNYVAALIAKYPGIIKSVEWGNELWWGLTDKLPWITSNQDLANLIVAGNRQMRVTVKTLDPTIEILGPSQQDPFGLIGTPALSATNVNRLVVKAGGIECFDKWSMHYYPNISPLTAPTLAAQLADLKSFMPLPIVITECGIPDTFTDADVWEMVQNFHAVGVETIFLEGAWYSKDPKASPSQAQSIACWNADGSMTPKLKALLAAMKSVNCKP